MCIMRHYSIKHTFCHLRRLTALSVKYNICVFFVWNSYFQSVNICIVNYFSAF